MRSRAWTPGARRWQVAPVFDGAGELARQIGTAPLVAQVLHNRGVGTPEAARAFLSPKLTDLHDPDMLAGVPAATERIMQAVADGQRIVLYGDYDVDGITGLAILHACLRMLGAKADFYVPHRIDEGYGVHAEAIRGIVAGGAELIVTIDCGISNAEALAEATAGGADVIVTDHHELPERLPEAAAVVHPALGDYPNSDLCGAGVAYKLAWALARRHAGNSRVDEPMRRFLLDATSLAALGTIADVVPLLGENRALAAYGLRGLAATEHVGLRALLESANLTGERLHSAHVGFVLAPRLNAAGRMGHARQAVELLTDAEPDRCREIARYLAQQNTERQRIEREIAAEAAERVTAEGLDRPEQASIVLASGQWHDGVIGIVASRLVDRFARPTVLICVHDDGTAHGSGRSIPGFHLRDALAACREHLIAFGGHAMAAGLKIEPGKIDAFAAAFGDYARRHLPAEMLIPPVEIDAQTTLAALGYNTVEQLERLAPFGQGNPPPTVALAGCQVLTAPRRMGRSGQTVALHLGQNGASMRAVGFNMGELADHLAGAARVDVAGEPCINRFNGTESVELRLKDVIRSA
ncbi:MAG TPA: single-stranded-DNA-specific exonuclease RecJ [Phycisphaerae bacterium]|nr:single-stranded-DNA-specific exonuclease RecJ [Phycisphaerae bacterium]